MAWRPPGAHDSWKWTHLLGPGVVTGDLRRWPPWTRLCWTHVWILLYCTLLCDAGPPELCFDWYEPGAKVSVARMLAA